MDDFHTLGHACLARKDAVEALRHWMNGLDAGDQRCSEAITRFLRDTLCLPGGSWETITHYLDYDVSESGQQSFHGKKFVGMKEVPLLSVDWPAFSFAEHPQLADVAESPTPIWDAFKHFCSKHNIETVQWGQYEVGFWSADRTAAIREAVGGPDSVVPIPIFFSASADESGLRIATPLARGSASGQRVRPSQRWLIEAFFRLGEDDSRDHAGKQATTLGEMVGRARSFCLDVESEEAPERLYRNADLFPRAAVWVGETNWFLHGTSLRRRQTPVNQLWAGYFLPVNPDARHLHTCTASAIHAIHVLTDWFNAAWIEALFCDQGKTIVELMGSPEAFAGVVPAEDVDRGCWPEQLTPIFAGMDRGDAEAFAAWAEFQERLDHQASKKGWLGWFRR